MRGEKLYIAFYELSPRGVLNARSCGRPRRGALLRTARGGVGCLHPWPELGDATLEEELSSLAGGRPLPLGRRTLDCAREDALAREAGISLFTACRPVPESHASLPAVLFEWEKEFWREAGFRCAKIKGGCDIPLLCGRLARLSAEFPQWSWRIDFNEVLTEREFIEAEGRLHAACGGRIEFYEDPFPYSPNAWKKWENKGVTLALDRAPEGTLAYEPPVRIIKPALQSGAGIAARHWAVTSYMDHPVGQSWAAFEASRLLAEKDGGALPCGLCTQHLYEPTAFSELLGAPAPVFRPAPGTGLGFDDLLETLDWRAL